MRALLPTSFFLSVLMSGCGNSSEPSVATEPTQPAESAPAPTTAPTTEAVSSYKVTVDGNGFTPRTVTAKKGQPVTIEFTRTTDQTCGTSVVFPELKITKALPLNVPLLIDLPSEVAHTYAFQCGMAMYKGKVVIE